MKRLDKSKYNKLLAPVREIPFNTLFAQAVIEQQVAGAIFVDDIDDPKTCYVVHPYGMTLLFGDWTNEKFNTAFKAYALNTDHVRDKQEWMQAFPNTWHPVLAALFGDKLIPSFNNSGHQEKDIIELNTRVNFTFDAGKFQLLKTAITDAAIRVARTDRQVFREMPGSVVPAYFWDTEDDFLRNGIGFSLYYNGKLASTAYSSCINDTQLELGIETVAEFRNRGFAKYVCQALIDHCIENNYEPVWACRLENVGSCKLAQKVGFTPVLELPYYRLSK